MSGWTPEPWRTTRNNHINLGIPGFGDSESMRIVCAIVDGLDQDIVYVRPVGEDRGNPNAARIVACVNALAGIPDPEAAVRELVEAARVHAFAAIRPTSGAVARLRAALAPFKEP